MEDAVFQIGYSISFEPTDGGDPIDPISPAEPVEFPAPTVFDPNVSEPNGIFDVMQTLVVPELAGRSLRIRVEATLYQTGVRYNSLPPDPDDGSTTFEVDCRKASLGDRVWVELDTDGIQDCSDDNGNGILGDAGDINGDECRAGVEGVLVTLYRDGQDDVCFSGDGSFVGTTRTDSEGFYLFDNLDPDDYCVQWTKPAGFDCTLVDQGFDDAVDSDGAATGDPRPFLANSCLAQYMDTPINLVAGENDLTWDLGLVRQPPPVASLGDRVWEDLDGDGVQDCIDGGASDPNNSADGIIGNAGDAGPECGEGVPGVTVTLFQADGQGNCTSTPVGPSAMTNAEGFYGFGALDPAGYCVGFDLSTVPSTYCASTLPDGTPVNLGSPVFTKRNQGNDATDSDADPASGLSESVVLAAGDRNLTVDAGILCPVKIGDRVWEDDGNGIQDLGEADIENVRVTLVDCGPDMISGTSDDIPTGQTRVTDSNGMYMFGGEDNFSLAPGKYFVVFDESTYPPNYQPTLLGVGSDALDSDCRPDTGITACTDLTASGAINVDRDCGLLPPPPTCDLKLDKSCRVEPLPPQPFEGDCKGKLQQFTVIWGGTDTISVGGVSNDSDGSITQGEEVTFFGPFSDNDVFVDVFGSSSGLTQSVFHVSCSDDDFNDPTDCGKLAGDAKGKSGFINEWILEGFIDAEGRVLDCTSDPSEGGFSDNCTYEPPSPPACKDPIDKVQVLTLEYTGEGCAASDNSQASDKAVCSETGSLSGEVSIMASGKENFDGDIYSVDPTGVSPGDRFSISFGGDDLKSTSFVKVFDGLNTETNELHTSCSQPLAVGDVFGSLRVVGMNGLEGGADVTYAYDVTNLGDPLTNVMIEDNPLGTIVSGLSLGTGDSERFEVMERIFGTKTNSAQASGTLSSGDVCAPASAFDTVTVEAVTPPCSIGIKLDRVEDDKLKIKLTNNDTRNRTVTMDTLTVSYPSARGIVEKIKLDGDAYKFNDSANPILGNPATFGPTDWTEADVGKRQIKPGDTKTLEIETFEKSSKDGRFELTVDFGEGCLLQIIVENQQVVLP